MASKDLPDDPTSAALEVVSSSPGHPERPIERASEDALGRMNFVRRLTDALIDKGTTKSRGIAIGITGAWGSGKSSVLNLLRQHIKETYLQALVVSFDPWLVSGRNDLISEFISELIRTINADPKASERLKKIGGTIAKYGELIAPAAATWIPLLGPIIKGGSGLIKEAVKSDESLTGLKSRLMKELAAIDVPIVVLIDELDRVEDEEIRTVAQLVRSVADFPGISYVLAYDSKRVIQALGRGANGAEAEDRGRAYLEKIVQLQIPLPVIFANELAHLLASELSALTSQLRLPNNFQSIERYQKLAKLLTEEVIDTIRDISRLTGTFHAIAGMLRDEVDWIDLLGFCALLTKAPQTVEVIRAKPDQFTDEIFSEAGMIRAMTSEKQSPDERLEGLLPASENNESIKHLIGFLFPALSGSSRGSSRDDTRFDALFRRRPLLTTLRLGLVPGEYSRAEIEALFIKSPADIAAKLREAYQSDTLTQLIDRFDDIYSELPSIDHVNLWQGIAEFAKKPDCEWITSYSPMHEVVQNLAEVLERCVRRNPSFQGKATTIFSNLRNQGEDELTALWLRRQIFLHGLFGRDRRSENAPILTDQQTEAVAKDMSHNWRTQHLSRKLIPCRWDLSPLYTMLDTGIWDDPCRKVLDDELADDRALDAFTLMLFGGNYTNGRETVEQMCSYDPYMARVEARLASIDLHETVRVAMEKAKRGGW
ncbi:KAP family P-loop NTPase fold protein [Bradyrhizobium manausense]